MPSDTNQPEHGCVPQDGCVPPAGSSAHIAALNDRLRRTGEGGTTLLSRGIAWLDPRVILEARRAMAAFDAFTQDNDPYGEHDCALFSACGMRLLFKVDYYNLAQDAHSPNPADAGVTKRVLTLMLAEEY